MGRAKVARWITALGALLFVPGIVFAQAVNNAQIHGTVQDPTGAAVAGATIKATKVDTGTSQATISGTDGSFVIPGLQVGAYTLETTAAGFSTYVQSGITLQVGQNIQLDVKLTVGSVTQQVQVDADAAMVETQDTSISEVVDQRRMVDLPLNGRQATDLIALSGGAATPPNGSSRMISSHDYVNSAAVSVSGGQINGNNYLLDGGDNNDSHSNVNMPFPFPDALQEFSVQTNGISARYGLHPGSVVNVVTKSGTNDFHGTLFEFLRNGDFNARNYFSLTQDNLHRNQYGGTVGGPLRKNKIFVFGGYQETRIRQQPASNIAFVATQAALNGDFSTLESAACQTSGKPKQLINPATGQKYANNYISPGTFTAPSLALIKLMPVSADPCGRLVYSISNPSNEYQYVSRADWTQSTRNNVFARYFILDYANPAVYTDNILTLSRASVLTRSQSIVLGDQFTLTPTLINSLHFTYTRLAVHRSDPANMPSPVSLGVNMFNLVPNFIYVNVSNYFTVGGNSNSQAKFIRNQYQWADDMDWIKGKQHFSFGAENIVGQMYQDNIYNANGYFNFNGGATNDSLADYLTGNVYTLTDTNAQISNSYEKYISLYFEDGVQLTKTLNVHAGVRWEPSLPETQQYNEGDHFDLPSFTAGTTSTVFTNAPPGIFFYGDKGIPKAFANGSYDDFAPRVGLAWDPSGKGQESIRASYGMFFDQPESFTDTAFGVAPPWGNGVTLTSPAGGFANPFQGYPGGNPFPSPFPPTKTATFNTAGTYINLPLSLHHPYMQQWDLSLQRQVGNAWIFTASYIGNKATHLRSGVEENPAVYIPGNSTTKNTQARRTFSQINPTAGAYYSTMTFMDDGVNTNYNAARLSAQHRFDHGYTLLVVYTYSHCLQDTETMGNKLQGNQRANPYSRNFDYGPCDYDLRHNLVGSFVYQGYKFNDNKLNLVAGGWTPAFLVSYYNGFPFNALTGTDASLSGVGQDRPNAVAGADPYVRNTKSLLWINPGAFTANGPGTFGTTHMNSLLGPHYIDADVNVTKIFKTYREQNLQMRFEFFNIFNHTNFQAPVNSFSSSTFGQIQAANPPRIIQLAAKYTF
ncbi:MAG: carboxypeptidase regulatory-like domain-containing protein [Anaerolineaceae bacterium]|nr:carboxypeptidase regulatory-like domain-containing protein [Anaerolineaceae bacterium]